MKQMDLKNISEETAEESYNVVMISLHPTERNAK